MTQIRILALRYNISTLAILLLLFIVMVPVLLYAGMWLTGNPAHALYQKPAFAAIIIVELYVTGKSRKQGESAVFRPVRIVHDQ